jgi:3,4-dihydroxy 2-butanone 4-phosphate synthase/GTP cyclohydrolase II
LASLGVHELILLTDNPRTKYTGLDAYNLKIVGHRPITKE